MEFAPWFSGIATLLCLVLGGYLRSTREDHKDHVRKHELLVDAHNNLQVLVAGEYMKKAELVAIQAAFKLDMKEYLDTFRADVRASIARLEALVK